MGNIDLLAKRLKEEVLHRNSRVAVVASERDISALRDLGAQSALDGIAFTALECDADLPAGLLTGIDLLIVEVAPERPESMRRLAAIRDRNPDLPVVAAISDASVSLVRTLVRQGIADVVSLPFDIDEVLQVALDLLARRDTRASRHVDLAPVVMVVRSIGGCGATSLATHLAADLAANAPNGNGAIIADLDLQFGSVADYLGISSRGDLANLLEAGDRLDEELLQSVVADAGGGLSVIAAPEAIMPLESVDTDQLLKIIHLLRRQYGYVVLDLPADWTNWTLSAALAADAILLVVEQSISSLRQARRRIELFRSVGIADAAVEVVVNRVERRLFRTISLDDVAHTLDHSVLCSIALEAPVVSTAQNQGRLVSDIQRKSKFTSDIAALGTLLRAGRLAKGQ